MDREKPTVRPAVRAPDGLRQALRRLPAYVYLDDVFRGRHVLEVGCGEGGGAHHLARAGAASVIAIDRSPASIDVARARYRVANLTFAVSELENIDLEDHAVDVVCVAWGEDVARWPAFLKEARRVLAREGTLVVLARSGDRPGGRGIGYHDLTSRLVPGFGPVRMMGVTPFVGFAVVEYAEATEVLDVELDSSLTELGGGRAPITDYVAVCGALKGPPRGYMVIELPADEGLHAVSHAVGAKLEEPAGEAESDSELRQQLARAHEERTGAEAEVEALRARIAQAEEEIGRVAAQAARELGEARRALHTANAHNESLEAQLAEARRKQVDEGELREQLGELEAQLALRDDEIAQLKTESAPIEMMVRAAEQHEAEMRERVAELGERDAYLEELRQEVEEVAAAERAAAEAAREATTRAAELEVEVRELRGRLSAAEGELLRRRGAAPDPALQARVVELEAALAERSAAADKATARWKETEAKTDELWKKVGDMQKELAATREQAVENARAQRQAAQIALTRAVDEASKKLVSAQDHAIRTERERQELERQRDALRAHVARLAGLPALGELEERLRELGDAVRAEEQTLGELQTRLSAAVEAL